MIFSPFQSRIKWLCISSEGYPKFKYASVCPVWNRRVSCLYIYRNLNTLGKGSKNRAILNRKHASSFVIGINIVGWTLKFYTFQLINKTQNILKGLYIVSSQHCALCVSMNFMTKSQWQLFIHKQIMYLWWLYIFDNNYTNFKTFFKYS